MIYKNGTWKKCLCFISKSGTLKKGEWLCGSNWY
jgi:hypothetical protein